MTGKLPTNRIMDSETMNTYSDNQQSAATFINFHGAAIIDANGNETPITEAMVQQALQYLIEPQPMQRIGHNQRAC